MSCDIHLRATSLEKLMIAILGMVLIILNSRLQPHLPGAKKLRFKMMREWFDMDFF